MLWAERYRKERAARGSSEISTLAAEARRRGLKNMYGQTITEEGDPTRPAKERLGYSPNKQHRHKRMPKLQQRWRAKRWRRGKK